MAQFGSQLKLLPSSAKRSKPSIDWNQCNICQWKSHEPLYFFTDRGKETFIKAAEVRQYEVYRRLIVEVSSITHVVSESFVVKYHRSCCNSYTSKQNIMCFAQKKTIKDSKSSSVQLYVQMVLLPDLIGLIVFSVKRKVIKENISSSKLNHKSLIRFLGDYIVKHINQNSSLHEGLSLYLAGLFSNPETVKMLNQNGMLDCSCLASTQEEADTCIILNALYSDKLYQENNVQGRIVVKSPDTNVLVLLVHYFPKMKNPSELWFQTGLITSTKDYRRYIPIHELCKSLRSIVCEILPAAYALIGCDTTSSFFGIGKKSMLKAL